MKFPVASYAVKRFHELQAEHSELVRAMGMAAIKCLVRQKTMDSDNGWVCHAVGLDEESGAFWGRFYEKRGELPKEILIVIDLADVDSIEFEIYDGKPIED